MNEKNEAVVSKLQTAISEAIGSPMSKSDAIDVLEEIEEHCASQAQAIRDDLDD